MAAYYTVEQGDYISKIAKDNGFSDYKIIWDHPQNANLKNLRKNPNVLLPGDQVFIPDMEERVESGATDKRHTFTVDKTPLKLVLILEDMLEKPIAGATCGLIVAGQTFVLTSDAKGKIEQEIPLDATSGTLVIQSDQTPFQNEPIPLKIGHLDPVDEQSGQIARLNNLGYFPGSIDDPDDDAFESAVEEFQCDHALKVDGDCGPKTQAKLKEVHGC